jgi:hypothetical protein
MVRDLQAQVAASQKPTDVPTLQRMVRDLQAQLQVAAVAAPVLDAAGALAAKANGYKRSIASQLKALLICSDGACVACWGRLWGAGPRQDQLLSRDWPGFCDTSRPPTPPPTTGVQAVAQAQQGKAVGRGARRVRGGGVRAAWLQHGEQQQEAGGFVLWVDLLWR